MNESHSLYAFIGVLATIIVMSICGAWAVSKGQDSTVYLAAITGLIGVIGTFRPRQSGGTVGPNENVTVEPQN